MSAVGDVNLFGMRVVAVKGRTLDLDCQACGTAAAAIAAHSLPAGRASTRCGATQGRTE